MLTVSKNGTFYLPSDDALLNDYLCVMLCRKTKTVDEFFFVVGLCYADR